MQQKQYTVMGVICWLFQESWPSIKVPSVFPPASKGLSLYSTLLVLAVGRLSSHALTFTASHSEVNGTVAILFKDFYFYIKFDGVAYITGV